MLLLGTARIRIQNWARLHIVFLDVGMKIPLVFGPEVVAAVLVKVVLSKLLLFLGSLNGFGVCLALPMQEKETFLPQYGVIRFAQGELGFSRFESR